MPSRTTAARIMLVVILVTSAVAALPDIVNERKPSLTRVWTACALESDASAAALPKAAEQAEVPVKQIKLTLNGEAVTPALRCVAGSLGMSEDDMVQLLDAAPGEGSIVRWSGYWAEVSSDAEGTRVIEFNR